MNRIVSRLGLTTLALVAGAVPMVAQQETGNISGAVTGKDGASLANVTVTATGSTLRSVRQVTTGSNGRYILGSLPPGEYEVTFTRDGLNTVKLRAISVVLGRTTTLPAVMGSVAEATVVISGSAPPIDASTANLATAFEQDTLDALPTSKDPWAILALTPGVDMGQNNVGGNMQGTQSRFAAYGKSAGQNAYYVDGVNLTDTSASGASGQYYDFDSFAQIVVSAAGHDASIGAPGVNVQMVTRRGTNDFSGRLFYGMSHQQWQSNNDLATSRTRVLSAPQGYNRDLNLSLSGPIIKDRLWFYAAYHKNKVLLYTPNSQKKVTDQTELEQVNMNLEWAITTSNTLILGYNTNEKTKSNRLPTWPSSSYYTAPGAGWAQSGPGKAWYVQDSWVINSNLHLSFKFGKQEFPFSLGPNAQTPADVLTRYPVHINTNTGVATSAYDYPNYDRSNTSYLFKGEYFNDWGGLSHHISFGAERLQSSNFAEDRYPGNAIVYQYDSTEGEVWFLRATKSTVETENNALFVNDVMQMGRWTFNAGLRYQKQTGSIAGGTVPGTWQNVPDAVAPGFAARFAAVNSPAMPNVATWNDFLPRLSVSYDFSGKGTSVAKLGLYRYASTMNTGEFDMASPLAEYEEDYGWADQNGDGLFLGNGSDWNEVDFTNLYWTSGTGAGTPIASGYKAPLVDEVLANYSHQFNNGLTLAATMVYTKNHRLSYTLDRGSAGLSKWAPGTVTDANGVRHNIYNWNGGAYTADKIRTNLNNSSTSFTGWNLTFHKKGEKYLVGGNVTLGKQSLDYDPNELNNPNEANSNVGRFDAVNEYASRESAKFYALYELPWDMRVSTAARYSSGVLFSDSQIFNVGRGTSALLVNGFQNRTYPSLFLMDLGMEKSFKLTKSIKLDLKVDVFNLFNANTVTGYTSSTITSSVYLQPNSIVGPRIARFTAGFSF